MTYRNPRASDADLELLSAYIDDELSQAERAALETRLAGDDALRAELHSLRQTVRLVRTLPHLQAPRDFRLDPATAQPAGSGGSILPWSGVNVWRLSSLAGLAASLLLIIGGLLLGAGDVTSRPTDSNSSPAQNEERLFAPAESATAQASPSLALTLTPTASPSLTDEASITTMQEDDDSGRGAGPANGEAALDRPPGPSTATTHPDTSIFSAEADDTASAADSDISTEDVPGDVTEGDPLADEQAGAAPPGAATDLQASPPASPGTPERETTAAALAPTEADDDTDAGQAADGMDEEAAEERPLAKIGLEEYEAPLGFPFGLVLAMLGMIGLLFSLIGLMMARRSDDRV